MNPRGQDNARSESNSRLDSWKQIANHLKCSLQTVRRWERREGLPVRRHLHAKQATVYAFAPEIDEWLKTRSIAVSPDQLREDHEPQDTSAPASETNRKDLHTRPIVIAILPLRTLGDDPEQEGFADGLTEEIILDIGQCCPNQLRVIASTSVMPYKQLSKNVREIGRELGVDYILEGGIRRYGRRVRLTARLIAARDQTHVWEDTYEIQLSPIFSLQQSLARQVADSLSVQLGLTPSQDARPAIPNSAEAHNAYIQGRSFFQPSEEELKKKLEQFYLAIEREPKFARSYAELALVYFHRVFRDYPPVITFKRIGELASKALKLDSGVARAHAMMAAYQLFGAWNWLKADASSRRAIKLNPSDPWARVIRAAYHIVIGNTAEAIMELEQAHRLGPQSSDFSYWFVVLGRMARQYDWTIKRCEELLELGVSPAVAHAHLGSCYARKGAFALALSHSRKAEEIDGSPLIGIARASATHALAGDRDGAQMLLQELVAAQERRYVRYTFIALCEVALGNHDQTLGWLEKALVQRDPLLVFLKADPRFDPLSDDPRFRKLLRRIGLPT